MEGFFKKEETQSNSIYTKGKSLSCFTCGLSKGLSNPKLAEYGLYKKQILIINTRPSEFDHAANKRWVGELKFKQILAEMGIDLYKDCLSISAVNCRPPKGRMPSPHEMNCCREIKVLPLIKECAPKLIIALGMESLVSLIGPRWKKNLYKIFTWRGFQIPDPEYNAWVCPMYSLSYIANEKKKIPMVMFKQDLQRAIDMLDVDFPQYEKPVITYLKANELDVLDSIEDGMIAFDYETTGIKPQSKKQKIICASVAVDENNAYVFPMPTAPDELAPFINLLRRSSVKKIAQNMKFEDNWTNVKLKTKVLGWYWDTMIASHLLDNRANTTGLKFRSFVQFGVVDYDSDVSSYLESEEKGGNNINRIEELISTKQGLHSLLTYCAYDSIYEYRLALLQMEQIEEV